MNPSSAYEQMRTVALDGRELEASVLTRAARKLSRCAQAWERRGTAGGFTEELGDALGFTQRLWTFLQVEIANPDHPMPNSVRRDIFRLSKYVDRTVMTLFSGGSLQDLHSLIAVNNEIAAGLASNRPTESPVAAHQPATQLPPSGSWG